MTNIENRDQQESEALLQSEALRVSSEVATTGNSNNNNAPTSNRNFSIRINVGPSQQEATIRRRRATPQQVNNNNSHAAPVHARTIDRFPGQSIETTPQVGNLDNQGQHTHMDGSPLSNGRPLVTSRSSRVGGGARRITIPLRGPNGRGAIRVTPGDRNTRVRIVTGNGNTVGQVQRVQVPRLEPQPLPYHASSYSNNNSSDETSSSEQNHEDRNEFKCLICFEFLQDPASCGNCQSRFCLGCIHRVARMAAANNTLAKCPTCRCEFRASDIRHDAELRERMQRANTVVCQYQGCNAQLLLQQVASHEQSCLFVPLKCRYATFGCEWKGTRQSLLEHESTCPLLQVSSLVEQFRQTRADHEHSLNHLQTRVAASNAMMELHASLIRRLQKRSYHPGDMLDLIYTVTCTPARFIYTKDIWRSLTACRLARGFLCNVLVFLPMTLVVLRIDLAGSRQLVELLDRESSILDQEDAVDSLIDVSLAFVIVLVWSTILLVFIMIGKNSVEWEPNDRSQRFLCHGAAFLSFGIQFGALEYDARYTLWIAVCICSTFFPSLVLTMIETVNGNNRAQPTDLWTAGRAVPIILFGIRYALVAHKTDILACLDAVMLQSMLRTFAPERMAPLFVKNDCFCTDIPNRLVIGYAIVRALIAFAMWWCPGIPVVYQMNSGIALMFLFVVNYLVNNLIMMGGTVATDIHEHAKENVLPNQSGIRKVCDSTGCLSFAVWIVLLGGIIVY